MATITNIITTPVSIIDNNNTEHIIQPGNSVTIDNNYLDFTDFSEGLAKGWITVTGWVYNTGGNTPIPIGLGGLGTVPNGTTNGTPIGSPPVGTVGIRIYMNPGDSVTFTVTNIAPVSAPTYTFTITTTTTGPNWDENLSQGQMLYITAKTGTPLFRWL